MKADAREARNTPISFAFQFPRLLTLFEAFDREANSGRDRNRRLGVTGVTLVLIALLYAASVPLLDSIEGAVRRTLDLATAVLGLAGTALGLGGLRRNSLRRRWLAAREKTETLRLFHFSYISARFADIEAAASDPEAQARYVAVRDTALSELLTTAFRDIDGKAHDQVTGARPSPFAVAAPQVRGPISPVAADIFRAWSVLRLDWQLRYCEAKLAPRRTNRKLSPRQLEHFFSAFGWICIGLVVLAHVAHVAGGFIFHIPEPWLQITVIWIALFALAARALEDGLKPQREVERYEQYRISIDVARQRFLAATDVETRLEIMRGFEQQSLDEMRSFLRTHAEARFLL